MTRAVGKIVCMGWSRPSRKVVTLAVSVTVSVAVAAAVGYVAWRKHGMDIETPVALPFARAGDVMDLEDPYTVHLHKNGSLFLADEQVSLAQLAQRIRGSHRPVIVCADEAAQVLHLWYLLDACPRLDTFVAVRDGWRTALLPATPTRNYPFQDESLGVVSRPSTNTRGDFVLASADFPLGVLDDADEAVDAIREAREERTEVLERRRELSETSEERLRELDDLRLKWQEYSAYCGMSASVGDYIKAVDVWHRVGVDNVVLIRIQPHPWTARQPTVPAGDVGTVTVRSAAHCDRWSPLALPLADVKPLDDMDPINRFPDKCVTIEVMPDGAVLRNREPISDSSLAAYLRVRVELWDRVRKRIRMPSREEPGSRFTTLPLLIRADRSLPWSRIRVLLDAARGAGFLHFGLMVKTQSNSSWSAKELEFLGFSWRGTPWPVGFRLECMAIPHPWEPSSKEEHFTIKLLEPRDEDGYLFQIHDYTPLPSKRGRNTLLLDYPAGDVARVTIEPGVPLWRAVELFVSLRAHGYRVLREP